MGLFEYNRRYVKQFFYGTLLSINQNNYNTNGEIDTIYFTVHK